MHYLEVEAKELPSVKDYAKERVLEVFGDEWESFNRLIIKESNWRSDVKNPKSSAYGLCQTMMSLHWRDLVSDFKTNPYAQIDWCIKYTKERYKTPSKALKFHLANNYF